MDKLAELTVILTKEYWIIFPILLFIVLLGLYWLVKELTRTEKFIKNIWIKASVDAKLIFCGLMIIAIIEFIF